MTRIRFLHTALITRGAGDAALTEAVQRLDLGLAHPRTLADFSDRRSDNRRPKFWMAKFQAHAAADEALLQHGASPGRAGDCDQNRLRTILWMPRKQHGAFALQNCGIAMMLRLDLQDGIGRQVFEKHAAFNFRLDDAVVHLITEVGVGREDRRLVHEEISPDGHSVRGNRRFGNQNVSDGGAVT